MGVERQVGANGPMEGQEVGLMNRGRDGMGSRPRGEAFGWGSTLLYSKGSWTDGAAESASGPERGREGAALQLRYEGF